MKRTLTFSTSERILTTIIKTLVLTLPVCATCVADTGESGITCSLRVIISSEPSGAPQEKLQLELFDSTGRGIATTSSNPNGVGDFSDLPAGSYALTVRGPGFETARIPQVILCAGSQIERITIKRLGGDSPHPGMGSSPTVGINELRCPPEARRELEAGNSDFAARRFAHAGAHYEKAIALYPDFAEAHNNLGLVLRHSGDLLGARERFAKALSLNPKHMPACLNLARQLGEDGELEKAMAFLKNALEVDPRRPEALVLLFGFSIRTGVSELILESGRRMHEMLSEQHGFVHILMARACRRLGRRADEAREYQCYLEEDPGGPHTAEALSGAAGGQPARQEHQAQPEERR